MDNEKKLFRLRKNTEDTKKKEKYLKVNLATLFFVAAILVVITVFLSFFVADRLYYGGYFTEKSNKVSFDKYTVDYKKVAKFQEVLSYIRNNYYYDYDENDLVEGAIKGLVDALEDPYSHYYLPNDMSDYNDYLAGSYSGIGVEVETIDEGMKVTYVFEDSPASHIGLAIGDVITHVEGKEISEETDKYFSSEGKTISIRVLKKDSSIKEYSVKVEVVKKQTVFTSYYDDIAYIQIKKFADNTGEDFQQAVIDILKKDVSALIIDLRNNGGGFEREASIVADIILPEGLIAYSENKNGVRLREIKSKASEIELPVVMLVNQNSASASELVAGAFKDFEKGKLIGVKTFGKAVAQVSKTFTHDDSGVVLTTSKYFTPSGNSIHGIGIEPDIIVEMPSEYKDIDPDRLPFDFDIQLQRALEEIEKMI